MFDVHKILFKNIQRNSRIFKNIQRYSRKKIQIQENLRLSYVQILFVIPSYMKKRKFGFGRITEMAELGSRTIELWSPTKESHAYNSIRM